MSRKLAIKRLKPSDLSFFETHFRDHPQSKQKAFNLDRRVIETELFPSLTEVVEAQADRRALLTLTFFGPGLKGPHSLARKIIKEQKNWRLNGEMFPNPDDDSTRYNVMAPDDFAVMEFIGTGAPSSVRAVLIAAAVPEDAGLHAALSALVPATASMRTVNEAELEALVAVGMPGPTHPIRDWLDASLVEDVALGGGRAAEVLNQRRRGRGMSSGELARAKEAAEKTGRYGEELLNYYFENQGPAHITRVVWESQVNAVAPYDFEITTAAGEMRQLDAKSTAGPFENKVHLSLAELHYATKSGVPYDIYRLFEVREGHARLRIARNVGPRLMPLRPLLAALPADIEPDSFSINPTFLGFDELSISIEIPEESPEGYLL